MMSEIGSYAIHSPFGLIAGNGIFPLEVAQRARDRGVEVVALAHEGETEKQLEKLVSECIWVKVGQLGKIISVLHQAGVRQAALAGGISRVKIFGGLKLDRRGLTFLAKLRSFKDDAVLRGVASEIEQSGIEIISAGVFLDRWIPKEGLLTKRDFSEEERKNVGLGWEAAKTLGQVDIGQTVVTFKGVVIAVEAVEGTDAAIERAGRLAENDLSGSRGHGLTVVKVCKPTQDLRMDLPSVGSGTIEVMKKWGGSALAIEAEKTLVLNPEEVVFKANEYGIAVRALIGSL